MLKHLRRSHIQGTAPCPWQFLQGATSFSAASALTSVNPLLTNAANPKQHVHNNRLRRIGVSCILQLKHTSTRCHFYVQFMTVVVCATRCPTYHAKIHINLKPVQLFRRGAYDKIMLTLSEGAYEVVADSFCTLDCKWFGSVPSDWLHLMATLVLGVL